jgi:hypothetical protein
VGHCVETLFRKQTVYVYEVKRYSVFIKAASQFPSALLLHLKPIRGVTLAGLELKLDSESILGFGCKAPRLALNQLVEQLGNIELGRGIGGSVQAKILLSQPSADFGWETDFLVTQQASRDYPDANFKMNYLWVSHGCPCGERHKVFVHRCFDNRQAIGTNLLRFVLAHQAGLRGTPDSSAYVAIVADEKAKRAAWDGSVGSYEEYFFSLNGGYKVLPMPPLDFLIIRG